MRIYPSLPRDKHTASKHFKHPVTCKCFRATRTQRTIVCIPKLTCKDVKYVKSTWHLIDFRRRLGIFLFTTASRMALGPTQPPIQWVPGALSLGVKWPGCEADHSPPSSAEVKNACSYTSTPQYVFTAWCLVKHRDNFTLPYKEQDAAWTVKAFYDFLSVFFPGMTNGYKMA
jgi:hypothetical protein